MHVVSVIFETASENFS